MKRIALLLAVALMGVPACATRSVTEVVIDHYDLDIKLRGQKEWFGGYRPLGYNQPVEISSDRLAKILGGIEVDVRKTDTSPVRERRNALSAKMLLSLAKSLPEAFEEASPNQQIIVMAQRKQMQKAIFSRKYLTSFTTYVKGDDLYVFFSRIEWKLDEGGKETHIPEPWPGKTVMPFETVDTASYEKVGHQGVRVKWRSREFGSAPASSETTSGAAAVSSSGDPAGEAAASEAEKGELAASEPTRGTDAAATSGTTEAGSTGTTEAGSAGTTEAGSAGTTAASGNHEPMLDPLQGLSAQDLRDLASLEDAYRAGRMDAEQYQRERARILARGH